MNFYKDQKTMQSDQRRKIKKMQECFNLVDTDNDIISFKCEFTATTASLDQSADSHLNADENLLVEQTNNRNINWFLKIRKIYPVRVGSNSKEFLFDVSKLCQFVAIAMWSVGDGCHMLLVLLEAVIVEVADSHFKDRWIHDILRKDKTVSNKDWDIIKSVFTFASKGSNSLHSEVRNLQADPVHVFMMANIIRRPIIIYGNKLSNEDANESVDFSGVYLPLLQDPSTCTRSPLTFLFHSGRIVPLLPLHDVTDMSSIRATPMVRSDLTPLTVKFLTNSEASKGLEFVQKYLDTIEILFSSQSVKVLCADTSDKNASLRPTTEKILENNQSSNAVSNQKQNKEVSSASSNQPTVKPSVQSKSNLDYNLEDAINYEVEINYDNIRQWNANVKCVVPMCHNDGVRELGGKCISCSHSQNSVGINLKEDIFNLKQPYLEPSAPIESVRPSRNDPSAPSISIRSSLMEPSYSNHPRVAFQIEPFAPNASILTLNNTLPATFAGEDEYLPSILEEQCIVPGCRLMQSRYTTPFCYEHADIQTEEQTFNDDVTLYSMMEQECAHPDCHFNASVYTQPFCHEHSYLRGPSQSPARPGSQAPSRPAPQAHQNIPSRPAPAIHHAPSSRQTPPLNFSNIEQMGNISLVNEKCKYPGCTNYSSRNVYPMCHEHAKSGLIVITGPSTTVVHTVRPVESKKGGRTETLTAPLIPSSVATASSATGKPETPRRSSAGDVEENSVGDVFREVESRSKGSTAKCKNSNCGNFGNSRCRGYCHQCFSRLNN